MNIQRVTLVSGEVLKVEFTLLSGIYLVKNFSGDAIYVSFDEQLNENSAIKIAKDCGQFCMISERYAYSPDYQTNKIYLKGVGEVEVQQL